jgi:hypothetical protein
MKYKLKRELLIELLKKYNYDNLETIIESSEFTLDLLIQHVSFIAFFNWFSAFHNVLNNIGISQITCIYFFKSWPDHSNTFSSFSDFENSFLSFLLNNVNSESFNTKILANAFLEYLFEYNANKIYEV